MKRIYFPLVLIAGMSIGYFLASNQDEMVSPIDKIGKTISKSVAKVIHQAPPYEKPQQQKFIRVTRSKTDNKVKSVETAISSYVPISGADLQVDLIGAIHIGDEEYFDKLNKAFQNYDVVLYELVAPPNTRPVKGQQKSQDPFSLFQQTLPKMMGMTHQLDGIDYSAKNFVHADLSFEDILAEASSRGETLFSFAASMFADFMKLQGKLTASNTLNASAKAPGIMDLIYNSGLLRESFAEAVEQMEGPVAIGGFTTLTPYIVDVRNDAALKVLDRVINQGHKRIAIYYGAAHMTDFCKKLLVDYGLYPKGISWVQAWDLTKPASKQSPLAHIQDMLKEVLPGLGGN